jgi:hypothetical protein
VTAENVSRLSAHFRTVATTIIMAVALWVGASVPEIRERQAATKVAIDALREELRQRMVDRYTATDAAKDFAIRDDMFRQLRSRVEHLENR